MRNTNKKGFTIVELVVVVAVIAILAAVLIPTFSGVIKKAQLSADQSAVNTMNKYLAMEECETVSDAILLLAANGLDLEDYKPLSKDHYFYFVNGRIVLADANDNVVYPKNADTDGQWMSLSGDVPMDNSWTENVEDKTVAISSGAQLADFINSYAQKKDGANSVNTIELTGTIDLKGAAANFGKVSTNITISAPADAPAEIMGLRADNNTKFGNGKYATKGYGYGLFGDVTNLTIENVTFSGLNVGNTENLENGTLGMIAGYVKGTLTLKNVTFEDCNVFGYDKVGAIAGQLSKDAKIVLDNVKFDNVSVAGTSYAAALVGLAYKGSTITVYDNCDLNGIKVSVYEPAFAIMVNNPTMDDVVTDGNTKYLRLAYGGYDYWDCVTSEWCWKQGQIAKENGTYYITLNGEKVTHAGTSAPVTGTLTPKN